MVLKDISTIYDCPHSTAPDEGEGYALIRTPNIGKGRLLLDNVHRVSKEVYDKRNKRAVPQEGDIIFAREAPAGNAAVITKGQEVCLGQRTVLIKPNQSVCNSEFLVYYLLAPEQQIKLLGFSHGATVQHVNIAELSKLPLILPPLATQQKIASILSTYDTLIENNTKRIHLLEQMAENLYKEWFVRFRFPGYENVEMENGLPKGWKAGTLNEITEFQNGFAFKSETFCEEGEFKIVTIKNVQDNGFDGRNTSKISVIPNRMPAFCKLQRGDILISLTGNVGRVCIVNGDNFLLNQRVAKLKSRTPYFCYSTFKSEHIIASLNMIAYGTAQLNLSPIKAGKIKLIIPESNILNMYETTVSPLFKTIQNLINQNQLLTKQRDLLLPRLMSGKLEVKS